MNRQRKVEGNNTFLCKSWPLFVRHPLQCPPGLWIHCCLAFTEQQTDQAPPAFSPLAHRPPPHHRSWRTPALVSSPRRTVTYGNAEDGDPGYNQVGGANNSMRTDDRVVVPI